MLNQLSPTPIQNTTVNFRDQVPSVEEAFISQLYEVLAEKAFDAQYSVPKLCRDVGMSSSNLYRKVTAITGKSTIEVIVSIRMDRAKQLLNSSLQVSEVAYECGFEDPDYFSRAFSKRFGVSPTRFRKQLYNLCLINQKLLQI